MKADVFCTNVKALASRKMDGAWKLCWAALLLAAAASLLGTAAFGQDWKGHGFDARNTANNPFEAAISPSTVAGLTVKWTFTTSGDVSARAAVADGTVFFLTGVETSGP